MSKRGPALSPDQVEALRAIGGRREVADGTILFRAGEPGSEMFVIEEGTCEVLFEAGKPGKLLGPGAAFGELALLSGGQARTATVVAEGPVVLTAVSQDAYARLVEEHPERVAELLRSTCCYLVDSEQALIGELETRNTELERALDFLRRTKEALSTVEVQAMTDGLTGLYNRRCLEEQAPKLISEAGRRRVGVILFDMDDFKQVNDGWGHAGGDAALIRFSDNLNELSSSRDLPCRLGGDEFALLLVGQDEDECRAFAERVRASTAALEVRVPEGRFRVTVTVGGAVREDDESWDDLYRRADRSLYVAKEAGRNRVGWGECVVSGP